MAATGHKASAAGERSSEIRDPRTSDRWCLLTARALRAFGDGFVSILAPLYLTRLGIGAFEIGTITTAMLLGSALLTLAVGLIARHLRTDRLLTGAAMLMLLSGIGFAAAHDFWLLLLLAFVGTLNPSASDVSIFVPLEQTALANSVAPERRTGLFAIYSLVGSLFGAVGSLFAGAPEVLTRFLSVPPDEALRLMFLAYGALGALSAVIYRRLTTTPVDATRGAAPSPALGPSRRVVYTLAGLFSIDSFGGGFMSSRYWLCGSSSTSAFRWQWRLPCSSGRACSRPCPIRLRHGWQAGSGS